MHVHSGHSLYHRLMAARRTPLAGLVLHAPYTSVRRLMAGDRGIPQLSSCCNRFIVHQGGGGPSITLACTEYTQLGKSAHALYVPSTNSWDTLGTTLSLGSIDASLIYHFIIICALAQPGSESEPPCSYYTPCGLPRAGPACC